jgi:hypothetical protein
VSEAPAISIAEALDLLGERRLMIRVHTLDASDTLVRLHAVAAESPDERRGAWALTGRVPEAVLAAIGDVPTTTTDAPTTHENPRPIIADDDPVTPAHEAELLPPAPLPAQASPILLAEVRPDEAALSELMGRLGRGAVTHIELVALDEALPERDLPPMTREHVLWWVRPVSEWAPRVRVPVVVELD